MPRKSREEWKVYKNVFDKATLLTLEKLKSQHKLDDLESPLSIGKEANIFSCLVKGKTAVAKIYRVENCNFNKMYSYICTDPRFPKLSGVRRQIIFSWVAREYHNLLRASEVIRVPEPFAQRANVILMEYIGTSNPAPKIKDQPAKDMTKFFQAVVKDMKKLYKSGLIHGDLSEYNILNYKDKPVFIDFSQGTQVNNPNSQELLERDVKNICHFFGKYVKTDADQVLREVTQA